jgi:hypothetical protein
MKSSDDVCTERIDFIIHLTSEALLGRERGSAAEVMHADEDIRLIDLSVSSVERFRV